MLTSNQNYHDKHKQFDVVTNNSKIVQQGFKFHFRNDGKAGLGTSQRVLLYSYLHVLSVHKLVF